MRKRTRPVLESLEHRELMDGALAADVISLQTNDAVTRIAYITPDRVGVVVNLLGPGTLDGTTVDHNGALNLVYDDTDETTQIIGHTLGGIAPLATVKDANVAPDSQAGSGANPVGLASFRPFDLIGGGTINFIGGIRKLMLNNVFENTEIFLRELPEVAEARGSTQGREITYVNGAIELVDGTFVPASTAPFNASDELQLTGPPPGIRIQINNIMASPLPSGTLPNPQIFGYDAVQGRLIKFDLSTGDELERFDVTTLDPDAAGVALSEVNDQLVVLVGQGDMVRAFNATDGTPAGFFTMSNLAGFTSIDAIGTTDSQTIIVDAQPGMPGLAVGIDVEASLNATEAMTTSDVFVPGQEFRFFDGTTGVAGFDLLSVPGSGFFDTFQPNVRVPGVIELNTSRGAIIENERFGLSIEPAPAPPQNIALGSFDQLVTQVDELSTEGNVVNLLNRDTFAEVGEITLQYTEQQLAGLSESFRPGLERTSVINVQGDIQAFLAHSAQGLVLNNLGTLHLLGIGVARDSFVAGFPVNHIFIGARDGVQILSPFPRSVGPRSGVTVVPGLQPIGPLNLLGSGL